MGTFAWYDGDIEIPEEKKKEFNENMIKLLGLGGMVNFDNVSLYGKEVTLISPVSLNEDGTCHFHYNYFEDEVWEDAGYDSSSNSLWSEKIGNNEFNFVICAGYFLTELYSEDYGLAIENGDILKDPGYVQWINYILDKDFSLEKRFELWKHYERYALDKIQNGYSTSEIKPYDVFKFIPIGLEDYMGGTELADIFYIANGTEEGMEDVSSGNYAKEVLQLKRELERFYKKYPNNGKDTIWQLITMPLEKRKCIKGTNYDILAEASVRIAARVFVYLSAEILKFPFWEEWLNLYYQVYNDEIVPQYVSDIVLNKRKIHRTASLGKMKTSEFLRNDGFFTFYNTPEEIKHKKNYYISDDDLMFWWDGSEKIQLSDDMINHISEWKQDYEEIRKTITTEEINSYDMLKNLMNALEYANNYYRRIFSFKNMFYEFLEHSKNVNYIAAVRLFEKIIEDNKEEGCIIEFAEGRWEMTSKNVTFNAGRVMIKRFLSFMANKKLRDIYFEF